MPDTIEIKSKTQSGNAMIYVLIALALFGFLTMTLSRSNDQADGQDIDDEQAGLYALELMEYVATTEQLIDMMLASGSSMNDLDFVNPTSGAFNTAPHIHKVFHPQGGGLTYQANFSESIETHGASGWYIANGNVEWTPTVANDVILSALRISKKVCEVINQKITGSKTIPSIDDVLSTYFETGTALTTTACADCEGHASLCVSNTADTYYGFYNIIVAQ